MLFSRCLKCIAVFAFSAPILCGCNGIGGLTAPQVAAVNCVLANDGATVVAVLKPGLALPATGLANVGCDAGTQIGQVLATPAPAPVAVVSK